MPEGGAGKTGGRKASGRTKAGRGRSKAARERRAQKARNRSFYEREGEKLLTPEVQRRFARAQGVRYYGPKE